MKYESEKNRKIRIQQRIIEDKKNLEEQKILDNLKNNTKVVSVQQAEASGRRMFTDAKRKQDVKRMQKLEQEELTVEMISKKSRNASRNSNPNKAHTHTDKKYFHSEVSHTNSSNANGKLNNLNGNLSVISSNHNLENYPTSNYATSFSREKLSKLSSQNNENRQQAKGSQNPFNQAYQV